MNYKKISFTALVAVVVSLITVSTYSFVSDKLSSPTSFQQKQWAQLASMRGSLSDFPAGTMDFTVAAEMTSPAVVHVETTTMPHQTRNSFQDPFRDFFGNDFFNMQPYSNQPQQSSGSGVIISDDGYIVTNNHVVDGADKVEVILFDKKDYTATVIGTDPSTDLALLKIDEKELPFIPFGNSDSVRLGQWVLAVGNPFNLESTVTAGIVSAKARNINIYKNQDNSSIESFIQTDAAVNPGNSGGALVNLRGELIGINAAIATPTGSYAGYSFAIPVNIVSKVVNDLLKFGMVQRGYLGVTIQNISGDKAKDLGLNELKGVYVDSVIGGSAGEDAGLRAGDVITKINGIDVNSSPALQEQVARYHPGDQISVTFIRGGVEKTAFTTLKNRNGDESLMSKTEANTLQMLGADFANLTAADSKKAKVDAGVKITALHEGKLSKQTQIREGFIITKVNNHVIKSVDDLKAALDGAKGGVMIEGVYPDWPGVYYYAFGL